MNLTPRQARLHLEAINRAERTRQRELLYLMRAARSDEGFKQAWGELED